MKKSVSLLLSLLMVISIITSASVTASAASTSDLKFELNEDGESYCVSRCDNSISGEVIIPDTYKGKPVTRIDTCAFQTCENITSIIIPDSVTVIDSQAFDCCLSLKTVKIPDSVEYIGHAAFSCCKSLEAVKIPDAVTEIEYYTFENCNGLKTISIGKGVKAIGTEAFYNCASLEAITVDENNKHFLSLDGVLFNKDKTELIHYPIGKKSTSYTIPDGVNSIGYYAFGISKILTSVIIPDSVTSIGVWAFKNCTALTSVSIGNNVKEILAAAFIGCTSLKSVTLPESVQVIEEDALGYNYGEKISGFTIFGYKGSAAEKYAKENGFTFTALKNLTPPTLKKVTNINGYVKVTWSAVEGADKYYVYRKTGTGDYKCIGSTTNKYFYDKKAGAGKTCRYIVRAKNENGYSEYSASKAIKHVDEPKLKTITNTEYGVKITWGRVTGAEKYNVYRKVSDGSYKYIGATSNTYYTDKNAKSGTKYYYAIRAKRDDSISSQSASLSKYYLADPTLKTPTSTTSGIKLSWSKVTGAEGYIIYRKTGSGSYTKLKTEKGVSNLSYTDISAKKGKKYTYRIKAYKSKTYSAYSNTKAITDKY